MKLRPSSIESIALIAFFALGFLLRTMHLDREAVEHFDEGIYASVLWYDGQYQDPYPARHLFAPPLLSGMMELASWIPGLRPYAPFVPSVILGTGTIAGLWLIARSWYGKAAGLFIAAVIALSEFHILYSRMALTDVACLFWIIVSVGFGTKSVATNSYKSAIIAGVACGLAWWTKYTGWLPIAILTSGCGLWWLWEGRTTISFGRLASLLGVIIAVALATFSPWWWQLQDVGGYQAVVQTHSGYVMGWSAWSKNLAEQLSDQFLLDGYNGQLSLGIGLFVAGFFRWVSGRSTWNAASGNDSAATVTCPPAAIVLRFSAAAFALTVISTRIKTPLMLLCIGIAGMSGIHLWPVLYRSWQRRLLGDKSPVAPGAIPLGEDDLACAPMVNPNLGLCTTLTWFAGMLLTTPTYSPFSRLFFPLAAATWLAAAGGVGWWLESNLSVARRLAGSVEVAPPRTWAQRFVTTMLVAAVLATFFRFDENFKLQVISKAELALTPLYADRRSIALTAEEIADACLLDLEKESGSPQDQLPEDGETAALVDKNHITPKALLEAKELSARKAATDAQNRRSLTPEERSRVRLIVYVYGEPALAMHLNNAGILVAPVSHLNLRDPGDSAPGVPTFLVFGPNAKRTPGFWDELLRYSDHFRMVKKTEYAPGIITLLDYFTTKWLREHPETQTQALELYRVE